MRQGQCAIDRSQTDIILPKLVIDILTMYILSLFILFHAVLCSV